MASVRYDNSSGFDGQGQGGDTVQAITDAVEDVLVAILELVRERPAVALAVGAAVVGALIGAAFAGFRQKPAPPARAASTLSELITNLAAAVISSDLTGRSYEALDAARKRAGKSAKPSRGFGRLGAAANVVGLSVQLMKNPIVRSVVAAVVTSQVRKRFRTQ